MQGAIPGPAAMSPPDARRRWSSATEARRAARGATRFALWSGTAGARQQLWAAPADQTVFAFAGIHRQGEDWPSFAILTVEPNRLLSHHGAQAMPVILRPGDYARWLTADWRDAAGLARPFPGQEMTLAEDPMV